MNHDDQMNNECHDMHVTLADTRWASSVKMCKKYVTYIDIVHSEFICHDICKETVRLVSSFSVKAT